MQRQSKRFPPVIAASVLQMGITAAPQAPKLPPVHSCHPAAQKHIRLENIPIVPLYYAKERPVINLDGNIIMADDERLPEKYRDQIEMKMVRFRTWDAV